MKYFAIVTVGAIIGACLSVPVSQIMINGVNKNMIMANSELNIGINILCALFIIGLVLSFCYFCTRKLNKVSAITAIRGGYTGTIPWWQGLEIITIYTIISSSLSWSQ